MALVDNHALLLLAANPKLINECLALVAEYLGSSRCDLCGSGKSVALKDGSGDWAFWCTDCALGVLPDWTVNNYHATPGSLEANRCSTCFLTFSEHTRSLNIHRDSSVSELDTESLHVLCRL